MTIESCAILIILLVMAWMFAHTGHAAVGVAVLPLVVLPVFNLVAIPISSLLAPSIPALGVPEVRLMAEVLGLAVTCILLGLIATHIKAAKYRRAYLIVCCGYSLILCCAMIFHQVGQIVAA